MVDTSRPETLTPEEIAAEFGWAASFLDHPELGPILRKAAKEGWTAQKLQTEIFKTNFWRTKTRSERAWENLLAQDPAEAQRRIETEKQQLRQVASNMNGQLTDGQLDEIAERVIRYGWQGQEIVSAVSSELLKGSDPSKVLRTGITGRSVQQIANQYGIPVSSMALDQWSQRIATGQALLEDFTNYARTQAKSLYPSLSADIDRGATVEALADPYRQYASRILGLNPAEIDFAQPKWNVALNFADDKGRRMMTLNEWGQYIRTNTDYGYEYTDEAQERAFSAAQTIAKVFGRL
jgi:hypothetical protein